MPDRIPYAAGIVLCGGRSSRMGRPKAWLLFGGETLLQRTVRTICEVLDPVVVVAAPDQELPPLPGDVRVARDDREYLGPLNGLTTGLAAVDGRAQIAYLSSCDMPFLTPAFVRQVVTALGGADICVPEVGGFRHPLAAVYRVGVRATAMELLAADRLRMADLLDRHLTRRLLPEEFADVDPTLRSLRNVNTPADYEGALRDAGNRPAAPVEPGTSGRP